VKDHPQLQLLKWTFQPIQFLEDCARRYGDCFSTRLGKAGLPTIFISHPEAVADLFAARNAISLDSGKSQVILQLILGKHSTILLDGAEHRRHRQLVMPPLHGERMRSYAQIIAETTEQTIQQWQPGQAIALLPYLSEITLQVIFKAVFGFQGTPREQRLSECIRVFLETFTSPTLYLTVFFPILLKDWGSWSPNHKFKLMMQELDGLMFEEIRQRRATLNPDAIDILTMLLLAKDETGEGLSDQEIRDELLTLLFAGHDSSSAVFSWVFYFVHAHPEVRARLLQELDGVSDPEPTELVRLPYLSAVCAESLRLRSAVPSSTARIANQPVQIRGQEFPAGTVLVPAQHLTHHRPDLYPDPYQFNPDRFLDRKYSPAEYYPFGGGSRYCVGSAFATYEMKIVLATVLRRYHLHLLDKPPIKTIRRGVNIAPKGGVKLMIDGVRIRTKQLSVASITR
jgi:unspecific monooxygenase